MTDGPPSYSLDWMEINQEQKRQNFYESFCLNGKAKAELEVSVRRRREIRIEEPVYGTVTRVSLNRTLRVPDDEREYELPEWISPLPMIPVDYFQGKLPQPMTKFGAVVPVYPREAVSIGFESGQSYSLGTSGQTLGIRVLCGGISAVTRGEKTGPRRGRRQDYLIIPNQNRLDGFLCEPDDRDSQRYWEQRFWDHGISRHNHPPPERSPSPPIPARSNLSGFNAVQQFVGMPASAGFSDENQVTNGEVNSMQLIIASPIPKSVEFTSMHSTSRSDEGAQDERDEGEAQDGEEVQGSKEGTFQTPAEQSLVLDNALCMSCKEPRILKRFADDIAEYSTLHPLAWSQTARFADKDTPQRRPIRMHELLFAILAVKGCPKSLDLEAVFEIGVTISTEERQVPLKVSPFLPMAQFYAFVKNAVFADQGNKSCRLSSDSRYLHDVRHESIGNFCSDGAAIEVERITSPSGSGASDGMHCTANPFLDIPGSWDAGVAVGGKISQAAFSDFHSWRWDWGNSTTVNVQMLTSAAFESLTGLPPPEPPVSMRHFLAAGIPFWHVIPSDAALDPELVKELEAVSRTEKENKTVQASSLRGFDPVACVVCEARPANTV